VRELVVRLEVVRRVAVRRVVKEFVTVVVRVVSTKRVRFLVAKPVVRSGVARLAVKQVVRQVVR